ncbi:MAG TPA: NAD-dependent epimerase/dehydratase family protein [Candidatus Tumulicola sp.]
MATDRVFLTGASGFVGAHVLRELLAAGYAVRALVRNAPPPGAPRLPESENLETVTGDLRHTGEFAHALDGCRYLVHTAALYSFAPRDRAAIHAVNVAGTQGLMAAADVAGVERAVVTSSSATVGHERAGKPADETCYPEAAEPVDGNYHASKLAQERAAFAGRVPVVAILPTAPVGPGDWKPTPTGKLVLDFMRGKVVAKAPADGGMNLVAVEDVARAHVAGLRQGRTGERYLVGGENLPMDAIWQLLATVTGRPMPSWRAPYALALATAFLDELRCRVDSKATPFAPIEGVRMSHERMYADSTKAIRELGHRPTPVRDALERAVAFYRTLCEST